MKLNCVLDCPDPHQLARFWGAALGYTPAGATGPYVALAPPDGMGPDLVLQQVAEAKAGKNRLHLDLATDSSEKQAAEVARLRELGARPVDIGQRDVPWVVLADPAGNELCVLDPRPVYRDTGPVAAIVVDSADPLALAGFWSAATGWTPYHAGESVSGAASASLRSPEGTGPYLEFLASREPRRAKNRLHLDLRADQLDETVRRLVELGARALSPDALTEAGDRWMVMLDPEDNEFCVCVDLAPAEGA